MNKIHRAWGVCLGCALLFFCSSGLVTNAFSIYLPYILSWNDFSNTQVSTLLTIRSISAFISTFLAGYYYEKLNLRRGMVLSGLFVAAGFFVYGLATNYLIYTIGSIFLGMGYGLGSMVSIGMVLNRWFKTKLSFATGICACGTGLSTLGLPTLITVLIDHVGLGKTFMIESVFVVVLITCSGLLIRNTPEEAGCEAYAEGMENVDTSSDKKSLATQPVYHPVIGGKLWLILIPMVLILCSYTSTAYSHLSILMTGEGISPATASIVILFSGLTVTSSKLMYGWLAGKITANRCNWIFGTLTFGGLLLIQVAHGSALTMGLCIIIYSAGLGMSTVGLVVWARELSSEETFERNNRYFQTTYAAGGILFSSLPGMMADRAGGSYLSSFLLFGICALIVLVTIQSIYRLGKVPEQKELIISKKALKS